MIDITKAREGFELALKKVSKFRFIDYCDGKRIKTKPEEIEICDSVNCDAGDNCVHKHKFEGVIFCIQ